jgi:hypothetical protein
MGKRGLAKADVPQLRGQTLTAHSRPQVPTSRTLVRDSVGFFHKLWPHTPPGTILETPGFQWGCCSRVLGNKYHVKYRNLPPGDFRVDVHGSCVCCLQHLVACILVASLPQLPIRRPTLVLHSALPSGSSFLRSGNIDTCLLISPLQTPDPRMPPATAPRVRVNYATLNCYTTVVRAPSILEDTYYF